MKLTGSSVGAVLHDLIFGRYTSSLENKNNLPADATIQQKLALGAGQPVRYWGPITQSSTSAPTLGTALLNQLGGTPTMGYTSAGVYTMSLTGAFAGAFQTIDELLGPAGAVTGRVTIVKASDDALTISTFNTSNAATNGLLTAYQLKLALIPTV